MRFYITDCNDELVGNPKGYKTHNGAYRQARFALKGEINARFYTRYPNLEAQKAAGGNCLLYAVKMHDTRPPLPKESQ